MNDERSIRLGVQPRDGEPPTQPNRSGSREGGASSVFASGVRSVDEGPPDWRYGAGQSLSLIGALEIKGSMADRLAFAAACSAEQSSSRS